jgi:Spy/CpxP family protein refolding chaperone
MKLKQCLVMAGLAAAVGLTSSNALAQNNGGNGGGRQRRGGGNFDPAQFQQRMMDGIRDQMGVTNDDEWNVIQQRVQKVFDARRDVGFGGGMRMFRGRRGNNNDDNNNGGQRRGRFGNPSPEQEALQQAIDNNAPSDQVKAALDKYRAAKKTKEAALQKAQSDLKAVLTPKQEAVAVLNGLLD